MDTPGYSRQQTLLGTVEPQRNGNGFLGSGVQTDGIRRIVNDFTTVELRITGDNYSRLDAVYTNAARMDNLLGDDTTSLLPTLQEFFSSMQAASEDPASLASRQSVLSQSSLLVGRINSIHQQLDTRMNHSM